MVQDCAVNNAVKCCSSEKWVRHKYSFLQLINCYKAKRLKMIYWDKGKNWRCTRWLGKIFFYWKLLHQQLNNSLFNNLLHCIICCSLQPLFQLGNLFFSFFCRKCSLLCILCRSSSLTRSNLQWLWTWYHWADKCNVLISRIQICIFSYTESVFFNSVWNSVINFLQNLYSAFSVSLWHRSVILVTELSYRICNAWITQNKTQNL